MPLAVSIAFYLALAILSAVGVGAATVYVVRRRRKPVTCEISWSPGGRGGAFRATVIAAGDKPRLVAESRPFEGRPPELPEEDAPRRRPRQCQDLVSEGWEPYDRGRDWWAMRLRRGPSAGPRQRGARV